MASKHVVTEETMDRHEFMGERDKPEKSKTGCELPPLIKDKRDKKVAGKLPPQLQMSSAVGSSDDGSFPRLDVKSPPRSQSSSGCCAPPMFKPVNKASPATTSSVVGTTSSRVPPLGRGLEPSPLEVSNSTGDQPPSEPIDSLTNRPVGHLKLPPMRNSKTAGNHSNPGKKV